MSFWFGDGFDLYSTIIDCGSYWDSTFGGTATLALSASGRFAGSRGVNNVSTSGNPYITKTSAANDAIHHILVAAQQTNTLTGTNLCIYFTLFDGATAQCSVVFRQDGAILLTAGGPAGTVLATYTGAIAATNTWFAFEIEVVINNTTGSIAVRKNGNTSNDFFLGSLNTRASTNNYANKLGVGSQNVAGTQVIDDLLWRSDPTSVPWVGDIRCFTRMPVSDASVAWSRAGTPTSPSIGGGSLDGVLNNTIRFAPYTMAYAGTITAITMAGGSSGNVKGAIWGDSSGAPGAVLASLPSQVCAGGNNTFTLGTPLTVTANQRIWIGILCDTSVGNWTTLNGSSAGVTATGSFATFPQANPPVTTAVRPISSSITYGTPNANFQMVSEAQQDAASTYNYSSTVSQSDLYTIGAIGSTPSSIVGVTTRGYFQKSDAGSRNVAVQLQSGATNVQSASTALNTTWGWIARTDLVDPATGSAWTATGVNNAQIGPVVTA